MAAKRCKHPAQVPALFSQAQQQHQAGQLAAAEGLYRQVLAEQPGHAESLHWLGVLALQTGQLDRAVEMIGRAIAQRPDMAAYHSNLGLALTALQRLEEAKASFEIALRLQPNTAETWCNLGIVLGKLQQHGPALDALGRAVALAPGRAEMHYNLAKVSADFGRLEEAVAAYRQALALRADYLEAHNNLGLLLGYLGKSEAAIACYRAALAQRPNHPAAHNNLGAALAEQGRLDEAATCYRRALALQPHHAEAHYNLGRVLLACGALEAGWAEFAWRWQTQQLQPFARRFSAPHWRGEAGDGRVLLIHAEQGFGDTLQFCRYAPLAARRGWRVVMEVPGPLVRVVQTLAGVAAVMPRGAALPHFDAHCPMMSLPMAMGTTLENIPAATPYLSADAAQWRARLAWLGCDTFRVGLVWAGGSRAEQPALAAVDRRRSLPPALLAPLGRVADVQLFSLQKAGAPAPLHLIDFMGEMTDFADTAALIMSLDLVISVDTAVAHLAAALGKPVWLLDRFDACWRWLTGRRDSPWYPTLRIYRQQHPGDWHAVIREVTRDLAALASAPSTASGLSLAPV